MTLFWIPLAGEAGPYNYWGFVYEGLPLVMTHVVLYLSVLEAPCLDPFWVFFLVSCLWRVGNQGLWFCFPVSLFPELESCPLCT